MEVFKFNHVFDHIEITLRELFENDSRYDRTLFVLGYNVLKDLNFLRTKYPGYRIITFQLEQLHDTSDWVNKKNYEILLSSDEIWDYDESNIQWMRQNYKLNARFFPLVYSESLHKMKSVGEIEPDIDVLFYGYIHERRAKLLFYLQQKFGGRYKLFDLYGIWGDELDSYIERSKIIVNMHSSENAKQEQARMYYPVINGRCVVSEVSPVNYMGNSIIELPYEKMGDGILSLLETGKWRDYALSASERYKVISSAYRQKNQF